MLDLVFGAKMRQTMKDKRKTQLLSRKHLIRSIFQIFGQTRGVQFLNSFLENEAPFIVTEKFELDSSRNNVQKLGMIFDALIISAQSASGQNAVFGNIIAVLTCEGKLLEFCQKEQPLLLGKQRAKLLEHCLTVCSDSFLQTSK